MRTTLLLIAATVPALLFALGCGDDDDRRVVRITQRDDACSPERIELTAGERVRFEVVNESSADQEVEGEDGTRLEEVLVPAGRTRSINFTAPDEPGTGTIKCYRPGGQETEIELEISS